MDLGDADDGGVGRPHVARDDRLQRRRDMGADDDRVDAGLGSRPMRADPGDVDVEEGAAGHHRTRADLKFADRQARAIVHAKDRVAGEAVEQPVGDHRFGAAEPFLGRLEDEMHGAVEILGRGEVFGRAQQHRCVTVMAAGVHLAAVLRAMREAVGFEDRQAVHIGPEADRARRIAGAQTPDDAGFADAASDLDAKLLELLRDELGRAGLLEAEFGLRMDVAPPAGQLVVSGDDLIDYRHIWSSYSTFSIAPWRPPPPGYKDRRRREPELTA